MTVAAPEWATEAAHFLSSLGNRWLHVQAVAMLARKVGACLPEPERSVLVAAAYLHDLGYAPELAVTGFHPLDGARYLRGQGYERLACLVAHHSGARFQAELIGMAGELYVFPRERSAVADALDLCDQFTGPAGQRVTVSERRRDIHQRYGEEDAVTLAYDRAYPYLTLAVARTVARLRRCGVSI